MDLADDFRHRRFRVGESAFRRNDILFRIVNLVCERFVFVAKYNRLLAIEGELGDRATYAGRSAFAALR